MPISEYLKKVRQMVGTHRLMMPGVSAIIVNDRGEVLLHRSADDGKWYVIGGAPDPGEEPARAAVREAYEETGLVVRPERLVGVYADPVVKYSNGDEVLYSAATFLCRPVGGELRIADDESLEVRYFRPDALPDLLSSHRLRVEHALSGDARAYFAWDEAWLKNL
jgi:8-oxo-dGTP pyrophosphatase MutT (NUDIX family)